VDYLVTPPAVTEWSLTPEAFATALRERWADAEVRDVPDSDPTYALDFTAGGVNGSFGRDGQMLGLNGDVNEAAAVAAWFREVVPPEEPLLFYDPALNGQVALEPGIAGERIAEGYLADAG
jgi:hypothetical protein